MTPSRSLLAVLCAPMLAACSFSFSVGGLNYAALEDEITSTLNENYESINVSVSDVECQRIDDPMPHDTFICLADIGVSEKVRVESTVTKINDYEVDFETIDAVFDLDSAARTIASDMQASLRFPVELECGSGIEVLATGDTFECEATDPDGTTAPVEVTVTSGKGNVSWRVLN